MKANKPIGKIIMKNTDMESYKDYKNNKLSKLDNYLADTLIDKNSKKPTIKYDKIFVEIQDINTIIMMIENDVDKNKILNYIKKYLLKN